MCVCVSVCLCVCPSPHAHTTARARMCPLVVHYWADLQLVHGFRCYDNIAPNANCQRVLYLFTQSYSLPAMAEESTCASRQASSLKSRGWVKSQVDSLSLKSIQASRSQVTLASPKIATQVATRTSRFIVTTRWSENNSDAFTYCVTIPGWGDGATC